MQSLDKINAKIFLHCDKNDKQWSWVACICPNSVGEWMSGAKANFTECYVLILFYPLNYA